MSMALVTKHVIGNLPGKVKARLYGSLEDI